jgi:hypothetical protein
MTSCADQLQQLNSVPLAVIRRQASASELSRVVPECCGLVWNAVRAQQAQAGRNVAIYWDGSIRLEWEWSFMDRLPSAASSYARQHPLVPWHRQRISGLTAAWALCTMPFAGGAGPTITPLRALIGRSTVIGSPSGIPIPRRFGRMSITSSPLEADGRHGKRFSQGRYS